MTPERKEFPNRGRVVEFTQGEGTVKIGYYDWNGSAGFSDHTLDVQHRIPDKEAPVFRLRFELDKSNRISKVVYRFTPKDKTQRKFDIWTPSKDWDTKLPNPAQAAEYYLQIINSENFKEDGHYSKIVQNPLVPFLVE